MKIVDRATFLALPPGTMFAKYEPCCFGELRIKDDTIAEAGDYWSQDLIPWFVGAEDSGGYFDALAAIERGEPSPPLDYDCTDRNGLFDQDQLFAVFERKDVEALMSRLRRALRTGYAHQPDE